MGIRVTLRFTRVCFARRLAMTASGRAGLLRQEARNDCVFYYLKHPPYNICVWWVNNNPCTSAHLLCLTRLKLELNLFRAFFWSLLSFTGCSIYKKILCADISSVLFFKFANISQHFISKSVLKGGSQKIIIVL